MNSFPAIDRSFFDAGVISARFDSAELHFAQQFHRVYTKKGKEFFLFCPSLTQIVEIVPALFD